MNVNPMSTNRRVLLWLCAYPVPDSANKWENRARIAITSTVFTVVIGCLIASTKFFIKNVRIDLEDSLNALFPVAAASGLLYMMITAIVLRYQIKSIFDGLENIYRANNREDLLPFLNEANDKSEWIWKMYTRFGMGGFLVNNVMMSGASIAFCLLTYGVFDTKHLFTSYKFVLPWDQTTKIGYFAEMIYGIFVGNSYFLANGAFLLLFISICFHHMAFYNRFQYSISKLGDANNRLNDKNLLCDLIRFHNLVKTWLLESADVFSPFVLIHLLSSTMFLALIVLQLDLQVKHMDFSAVIILTGGLVSASNLFFLCFFGKLATEGYEKLADCVFESNWLELPLDLKKYLILMIQNTQRPVQYHGFGLVFLNLETFTSLIKTVFSYYMLFKTMTEDY